MHPQVTFVAAFLFCAAFLSIPAMGAGNNAIATHELQYIAKLRAGAKPEPGAGYTPLQPGQKPAAQ